MAVVTGLASLLVGLGAAPARATLAVDYTHLVDDRNVTITSAADVTAKRDALTRFIWGADGFPTKQPAVEVGVASPLPDLENLRTVQRLRFSMESDEKNLGYLFIPQVGNNRAAIVHQGHDCTMDDRNGDPAVRDGLYWTSRALLAEGYAVAFLFQPHFSPEDCRLGELHDSMFPGSVSTGSPIKFFLEPAAETVNYLRAQGYQDLAMTGLSGGGWTTMLYSAIDPRIRQSFPVAGSMPLYLRPPDARAGDIEQVLPDLYSIAGHLDLYLMAGYGDGRSSVQVFNRRDNCCWGEYQWTGTGPWYQALRDYEVRVRQALAAVGPGSYRIEIDDAANYHTISYTTAVDVILGDLNGSSRVIGAADSSAAFVRGTNGNLWERTASQWVDTGLPTAGAPAVAAGSQHGLDVFYRSPDNVLTHAYVSGGAWVAESMGGSRLLVDPVAIAGSDGRWDVFTTTIDFRLYRWMWRPGWGSRFANERVSDTATILGPPSAVSPALDRYDVFFRGWDQAVWEVSKDGAAPWALHRVDGLGARLTGYPAAVADGSSVDVFARAVPSAAGGSSTTTVPTATTSSTVAPAPSALITAPANGATVSGTVNVTVSATSSAPVTKVEVLLNGVASFVDASSPYQMAWKTTNMVDGRHTLQAKAYDAAGNVLTSPLVTVTVNNTTSSTTSTSVPPSTTSTSTTSTTVPPSTTTTSSTTSTTVPPSTTTTSSSTTTTTARTGATAAPAVSLTAPADGATLSGTVDVTVSATSNVGITKVEVWLNGVPSFVDFTSPYQMAWKTTNMVDGRHTLQAKMFDATGAVTTSSVVTVTVNNTTPIPTAGTTSSTTSTSTTSTTSAPATTSASSSTSTSTTATSSITTTTTRAGVDTVPPTVSLTGPADGATVSGLADVTATASDNVGVTKVEVWLNGVPSFVDFTSPYQMAWKTTNMVDGKHTLQAKAYDAAGLVGTSPVVTVTVNNTNPGATTTSTSTTTTVPATTTSSTSTSTSTTTTAPPTTTSSTTPTPADTAPPTVSVTDPAPGTTVAGTTNVTATATDNVGVTTVELLVDGTLKGTATTAPYAFAWDANASGAGTHTLSARARDAAGNVATSAPVSVTVGGNLEPATAGQLVKASRLSDGSWQWAPISPTGGIPVGSPSAATSSGQVRVYSRLDNGDLVGATVVDGTWRVADHGGHISRSPTAVPDGVWARGVGGDLAFFDGTAWTSKGGRLE